MRSTATPNSFQLRCKLLIFFDNVWMILTDLLESPPARTFAAVVTIFYVDYVYRRPPNGGTLTLQRYVSVRKLSMKQLTYSHRLACRRLIFMLSPAPRHCTHLLARKRYIVFRKTPVYRYGCAKLFHQTFPTSSQCPAPLQAPNDLLSSAKRTHVTLELPKPSSTTPSHQPQMCHAPQVFPTVLRCPAPSQAPRRRIVVRKTVIRHPPASGTLPPFHGSPKFRDDVSPSAKRPLYVLASLSIRSRFPPGPKTMYRLPQNGRTPSLSFRNPSTSPWLSQAPRRHITDR